MPVVTIGSVCGEFQGLEGVGGSQGGSVLACGWKRIKAPPPFFENHFWGEVFQPLPDLGREGCAGEKGWSHSPQCSQGKVVVSSNVNGIPP